MSRMADRISTLPEEVLFRILSFLPTEDAVATSVLSKRWELLWVSVPALDFDDETVKDETTYARFARFVYRVMLSRHVSQPIERFRLHCGFPLCDSVDFKKWINAAIQRGVKHLDLCHSSELEWFDLPSSIFSRTTLVDLRLHGFKVNAAVNGFSFHLPSLKVMHLSSVDFFKWQYRSDLLFACPMLEDLNANHVFFSDSFTEGVFEILPKLVSAVIDSTCIPLKLISNVKFLYITKDPLAEYPKDIPTFHNLTYLELTDVNCPEVVGMLEHCPKVQTLLVHLKGESDEIYDKNWACPQCVPECLSLHLTTCGLGNYGGLKGEIQLAGYIMQNAKLLSIMAICSIGDSNEKKKLEIVTKLASLPRVSGTCELGFE